MQYLLQNNILVPLKDRSVLVKGTIVRRVGKEKDQQGIFVCADDTDGLILVNVINMKDTSFEADAGILRPGKGDNLYYFTQSFGADALSQKARAVLFGWVLYKKHHALQRAMQSFLECGFAPAQILDFEKTGNLKYLFVPLQQKFKIGKFEEKINWNLERKKRFAWHIENMRVGDHITYIAAIGKTSSQPSLFYSVGTQPHESTLLSLRNEVFNFKADRGGHISCVSIEGDKKKFLVDAGSNFMGGGSKASIDTAKSAARALGAAFKKCEFIPMAGRGAFDGGQSY